MDPSSPPPVAWVDVRLYADLAELAGMRERAVPVGAARSVKDVIESCGVPHTELGLILIDTAPVPLRHRVTGGERVAAYPPFLHLDLGGTTTVLPPPIPPRFVLDVHLGTLTRRLRVLGFDCWYRADADDLELARIALDERRILVTRDRHLLMRRAIVHGYLPRSDDPETQAIEVVRRFALAGELAPYTRCVVCNGDLATVDASEVADEVPPRSRAAFATFARCESCARVYWPGSHLEHLRAFVARAHGTIPASLGPPRS